MLTPMMNHSSATRAFTGDEERFTVHVVSKKSDKPLR